jgi:hypothetical protein
VHTLLLSLLTVFPGSPRSISLFPEAGSSLAIAATATLSESLLAARKLSDQLRYEEAVVEYQKYLATPDRPLQERSQALFELGFVHLVLGDEANAEIRATEAFEQDSKFALQPGAPNRQQTFYQKIRKIFLAKPRLELTENKENDVVGQVRATVVDPEGKVIRVLLRHALSSNGPFYSTEMSCESDVCSALIPPPSSVSNYTAYYYVEALDATQATRARVGSTESPLQLAVIVPKPWYQSPVVWGVAGAVIVAAAAVAYFATAGPVMPTTTR